MITVGALAQTLKQYDEILAKSDDGKTVMESWLITYIAKHGIFIIAEIARGGVLKRTWFNLDEIVHKVTK